MKSRAELPDSRRPYRQTARAEAAEANARRIIAGFRARMERQWFEEIRLEDVAQDADVTVQTVVRRFGGKEGLLDAAVDVMALEIKATRTVPPGDPAAAVRAVIDDYEVTGDVVMRALSQEERHATLQRLTNVGRAEHRRWLAETFAPWLDDLPPEEARRRLDGLVVATDVYVWKLIRRDMKRPVAELQAHMERLVSAVLSPRSKPSDREPS